jgi:hypothetical protein
MSSTAATGCSFRIAAAVAACSICGKIISALALQGCSSTVW